MKRIVFLLVLLLLLTSCGQEKKLPVIETYPVTLSGTLESNGASVAITVVLKSSDSCDIGIDSPDTLSGYRFEVDCSRVRVYYDDMQIEPGGGSVSIPFSLLPEMLSVSRGDFEYSRNDGENTIYHYTKNSADTAIYVRKGEELPCRIEYKSEGALLTLDIESFIIQ